MRNAPLMYHVSAGNENTDLNQLIPVNASYNPCTASRNVSLESNMLCVMATDPGDKRWFEILPNNQPAGSNYGSMLVDLGAPGRQVLSTVPQLMDNGECMACCSMQRGAIGCKMGMDMHA